VLGTEQESAGTRPLVCLAALTGAGTGIAHHACRSLATCACPAVAERSVRLAERPRAARGCTATLGAPCRLALCFGQDKRRAAPRAGGAAAARAGRDVAGGPDPGRRAHAGGGAGRRLHLVARPPQAPVRPGRRGAAAAAGGRRGGREECVRRACARACDQGAGCWVPGRQGKQCTFGVLRMGPTKGHPGHCADASWDVHQGHTL